MTIGAHSTLTDLRADFLATSTCAMPLAGMICWGAIGIAGVWLPPRTTGMLSLYVMAGILPLAFAIERVRGRNLFAGGNRNPLTALFLLSILSIGLTVPLVIAATQASGNATMLTLGMAILAGVIWIPYGWAADDRTGIFHAIGRAIGSYLAFALVPQPFTASAICAVVVGSYLYSLAVMKKPVA
jgi:hypothetical protein